MSQICSSLYCFTFLKPSCRLLPSPLTSVHILSISICSETFNGYWVLTSAFKASASSGPDLLIQNHFHYFWNKPLLYMLVMSPLSTWCLVLLLWFSSGLGALFPPYLSKLYPWLGHQISKTYYSYLWKSNATFSYTSFLSNLIHACHSLKLCFTHDLESKNSKCILYCLPFYQWCYKPAEPGAESSKSSKVPTQNPCSTNAF